MQALNLSPFADAGTQPFQTRLDNWAPTGIRSNSVIRVWASDNTGNRISGIDATGISDGDIRVFLSDTNSRLDDGVLVFLHEDPNSLPANRIHCPDGSPYAIAAMGAGVLIYGPTNTLDPTERRWVPLVGGRSYRSVAQALAHFPELTPPSISGVVNDWHPSDAYPYRCNPDQFGCSEAGQSGSIDDVTVVRVSVDATGATLTGLLWPGITTAAGFGPVKTLQNWGPGTLTLTSQDARSAVYNQFYLPTCKPVIVPPFASVTLWHKAGNTNWFLMSSTVGVHQ